MTLGEHLLWWKAQFGTDEFPDRDESMGVTGGDESKYERDMLILLDAGVVGMDGFKYCWPDEAKMLWRKFHPARKSA